MRLERRSGQVGKQHAVEAAYQELTGNYKPYHRIAAEIYGVKFPTAAKVQAQIQARFGVTICEKTASQWINKGNAELAEELVDQHPDNAEIREEVAA